MKIDLEKTNMLVPWYLLASFAYYQLDDPLITDSEFDEMARELLKRYDSVEHYHKHLISKDDLKAGSLLLAYEDYPVVTRETAVYLLAIKQDKK